MGKSAKGINIYFLVIAILLLITVWISNMNEQTDSYTRGEFIEQLEKGEVVYVEIHPNAEVPTGTLLIQLHDGSKKTLHVSDVVAIQ